MKVNQPIPAGQLPTPPRHGKTVPEKPDSFIKCKHRGDKIGKWYCTCKNKPDFFLCNHPEHENCIMHNKPTDRMKYISDADGTVKHVQSRPSICSICEHKDKVIYKPKFTPRNRHPHSRPFTSRDLEWISTQDLAEDALKLVQYVDPDTCGIIGVPRSGLIPAAIVATHCHLPLFELTRTGIRELGAGSRGGKWKVPYQNRKYLLIDDSSHNGGAMLRARNVLNGVNVTYAAVYTLTPETVDVYSRILDQVHIFDWNIFNNYILRGGAIDPRLRGEGFMMDWDGILSPDTTFRHTDKEEQRVIEWIQNVRPMRWIPRFSEIPYVVSFRLEKHRKYHEEWLNRWNIRVNNLVLHKASTFAERDSHFSVAEHKGKRFKETACTIFVESCPKQSKIIAEVSGKPVLCPVERKFYVP